MLHNKIKICHVTFDMRIGGAEQVILNLVTHTDPSRFDVSILCLENRLGPWGEALQQKGYATTCLGRRPGFDIPLILNIRRHILAHDIQVLHCHQYTPYVYGVMAAMLTRCRVIFTEHGRFFPDVRKPKRILINPFLNLFTHRVTAISKATRQALIQYENFPARHIAVVYNGIASERFQKIEVEARDVEKKKLLGIDGDVKVLGTVARLDGIKNQQMMIKALKKVHQWHPETKLLIVGDGPERQNLEKLVDALELSSHVMFTGFRQDTHLFYQLMDIFLLTSFSEGTAMTLLEAMASGVPCIATGVGGNPEIVEDERSGFLVPSDDEIVLAKKISFLFNDSVLMKNMGKEGRFVFQKKFLIDNMIQIYHCMYDKCVL